jgi:hypothetical protein
VLELEQDLARAGLDDLAREHRLGGSRAETDAHPRSLRSRVEVDHGGLDEECLPGRGAGLEEEAVAVEHHRQLANAGALDSTGEPSDSRQR